MMLEKKKSPSKEDSIKSILVFLGEGSEMPKEMEEEEEEEKEESKLELPRGEDLLKMLEGLR